MTILIWKITSDTIDWQLIQDLYPEYFTKGSVYESDNILTDPDNHDSYTQCAPFYCSRQELQVVKQYLVANKIRGFVFTNEGTQWSMPDII